MKLVVKEHLSFRDWLATVTPTPLRPVRRKACGELEIVPNECTDRDRRLLDARRINIFVAEGDGK